MKPSFSISILISSPALSQFLVITAEPAGVPVGIKSPGSSVKAVDKYSTNVKQSKIKSLVEADCLYSPFTYVSSFRLCGLATSSLVTI